MVSGPAPRQPTGRVRAICPGHPGSCAAMVAPATTATPRVDTVRGVKPQRRARAIAMTPDEIDAFLAEQRTCRVATNGVNGPHATPLWYAWDGSALWLTSLSRSQRWTDLQRDPRVAVVVDDGEVY